MGSSAREWLVVDRQGGFAMGSSDGFRFRKYHGFYQGLAGRSETSFLSDLELVINGIQLWPHCYQTPEGPVVFPDPLKDQIPFAFDTSPSGGPVWTWKLAGGVFELRVEPGIPGGIRMSFSWRPERQDRRVPRVPKNTSGNSVHLVVRPLCALRNLHWLGGKLWIWEELGDQRFRILSDGADGANDRLQELLVYLAGRLKWRDDPVWYYNFHYSEESRRGYASDEDLFSAGVLEGELQAGESCSLTFTQDPNLLPADDSDIQRRPLARTSGSLDFVLMRPAGIAAGLPWFGEWARDTFVSLPGVVSAWLASGEAPRKVGEWTHEVLSRWGEWIQRDGMLPNLIGHKGEPQWESADGTLWYCHSLAALWAFAKAQPEVFGSIANLHLEFQGALGRAIESIAGGHHRFLRVTPQGDLEVTEPHSTWMDARIGGSAVTPRIGRLPEINALWFQARCLHTLWREPAASFSELENLGRLALATEEFERPNRVFLHSIPFAPSFVLRDASAQTIMTSDMGRLADHFWTPVGLRTLDPRHPDYQSRCVGSQEERDLAYHQGPAWGWLGGHFEMARNRQSSMAQFQMFQPSVLSEMPIEGHIPELFDAEAPFSARGAPAQAWSIACVDEAETRRKLRVDTKISEILAERWTERGDRKTRRPASGRRLGRGLGHSV